MPPRKSDPTHDAPDVAEAPATPREPEGRVGEFVCLGATQVTTAAGEWLVDPETGCITGVKV